MKFESLALSKFGHARVQKLEKFKGGVAPTTEPIPPGGFMNITGGGTIEGGGVRLTYESDNDIYDGNGNLHGTDHINLCNEE